MANQDTPRNMEQALLDASPQNQLKREIDNMDLGLASLSQAIPDAFTDPEEIPDAKIPTGQRIGLTIADALNVYARGLNRNITPQRFLARERARIEGLTKDKRTAAERKSNKKTQIELARIEAMRSDFTRRRAVASGELAELRRRNLTRQLGLAEQAEAARHHRAVEDVQSRSLALREAELEGKAGKQSSAATAMVNTRRPVITDLIRQSDQSLSEGGDVGPVLSRMDELVNEIMQFEGDNQVDDDYMKGKQMETYVQASKSLFLRIIRDESERTGFTGQIPDKLLNRVTEQGSTSAVKEIMKMMAISEQRSSTFGVEDLPLELSKSGLTGAALAGAGLGMVKQSAKHLFDVVEERRNENE